MAKITPAAMLEALVERGVINEKGLVSLLGVDRKNPSINTLELALERDGIMDKMRITRFKSDISGIPPIPPYTPADPKLPAKLAVKHGLLLVKDGSEIPNIAVIEDTEENLNAVEYIMGGNSWNMLTISVPSFKELFENAYGDKEMDSRPRAQDLFELLDDCVEKGASDLHLAVGIPPRARIDGYLEELPYQPLEREWLEDQVNEIADDRHLEDLDKTYSCDLAYTFGNSRFRVNIANDAQGLTGAFRKLPSKIPTPEEINLPLVIAELKHLERGIVLITGPTGSGKSTTLAALLSSIINESARHVITLEDPIEFRFPRNGLGLVNQRELGKSLGSFQDGLRDSLRQDPDVILVGELRDSDTIKTAITAAETGHLVFGTLHTYDAASTLARVVNSFPSSEQDAVRAQLSQLLKAVVSQTLVPRAGGKGRVAAHEILINNPAVAANLRKVEGQGQLKQLMQSGLSEGMATMEASLAKAVVAGLCSKEEAEFRARDREEFTRMLDYYSSQVKNTRNATKEYLGT